MTSQPRQSNSLPPVGTRVRTVAQHWTMPPSLRGRLGSVVSHHDGEGIPYARVALDDDDTWIFYEDELEVIT